MVLAAGLGTRMRPITDEIPKPLVNVGGRPLVDHALDRLADSGIDTTVVNVHHLAERLISHLEVRNRPRIVISDEREQLLETGGGVLQALPALGRDPFFILNSDSFWIEGPKPNLRILAEAWDANLMDVLLMLAPTVSAVGYEGRGDFFMDGDGRLMLRPEHDVAPFVYTGVAIVDPVPLFVDAPVGPFSLNLLISRVNEAGRLFGVRMDGAWFHVGTPTAINEAERALQANAA
ncbi:MAG: nucleotidyltransferase family protein [Alphaproteobacteria bacterium]